MSQRRFLLLVALACLACGIFAWRTARVRQATEQQHHLLLAQKSATAARLQRVEAELASLPAIASAPTAPAKTAPTPPAAQATPSPGTFPVNWSTPYLKWMEDPKNQLLRIAFERSFLGPKYGPFFLAENLSPEQIARVKDLLVRPNAYMQDISEISRLQNLNMDAPELRAQYERDKADVKAALIEVLGADRYARLQDYQRSVAVRQYVSEIAGVAALNDVPFTAETAEALVAILARATPHYALGDTAAVKDIDWNAAEAGAAKILSPAQLKLLHEDGDQGGARRLDDQWQKALFTARRELRQAAKER